MILGLAVAAATVQASGEYRTGTMYVSPVLAHWMNYENHNRLDDGPLWGARFGVNFNRYLGVEGFYLRGPTEISPNDSPGMTKVGANYAAYGAEARVMIPAGPVIPFMIAGWGQATMKPEHALSLINGRSVDVSSSEKRNLAVFGAGLEVPIERNVSLRFEVIDHYISRDFIDKDYYGDNKTHNMEFGAGITFLFGGKKQVNYTTPAPAMTPQPEYREPVIIPVAEPQVVEKVKAIVVAPVVEKKIVVLAFEDVNFDFDKATLSDEAKSILKRSIQLLKDNPKTEVRIAGYTSASGARDYNQKLSERRATAVREYLISEGLVTSDRLTMIGYGERNPAEYEVAPKNLYSKEAKANMRVLFEIVVK
jgi:outer membrane protein OmpA-like peptidoglycan-associated protein